MKTHASTKGLVMAGIIALMLPLSAWSQSSSSQELSKGSPVGSDASDKAADYGAARSGGGGAVGANALRCDNPRNEDERAACEEREKSRGGAAEGHKDESFGAATSGRPDPERSTERESRSTPKSTP